MALIKRYAGPNLRIELHKFKNGYQMQQRERLDGEWEKTYVRPLGADLSHASNATIAEVYAAERDGYRLPNTYQRYH